MHNTKSKILKNSFFSIILELTTILSSLVIPNIIIRAYGSEANGLTHSIKSFLGYIALLQLGAGSVIKATLYKPLVNKDHTQVSIIIKTTERFFRKIGMFGILYLIALAVLFPTVIKPHLDFVYAFSLVIIIGIENIAQYLFGITYQMVLESDQRSYVYSLVQITTILLNFISVFVMVRLGFTLQIVLLCSSFFFVARPIFIGQYVRQYYKYDSSVKPDNSYIRQRWAGFAHGLAFFIHSKTDIFVLTVFSTLSTVSIYSIYATVTNGLTAFINCIDKAVRAAFGHIMAKDKKEALQEYFNSYNTFIHIVSSAVFSTAAITIYSFIDVYSKNINDADYKQPLFGTLIITAEMFYCLRLPYNSIIYAGNRFSDTKVPAFIEAIINILVSSALVFHYGLVGVAIGTLVAMIYRTGEFAHYLHNNLLFLNYPKQIKRYMITMISYFGSFFLLSLIKINVPAIPFWILYALAIFVIDLLFTMILNFLFDRKALMSTLNLFLKKKNMHSLKKE